MASFRPDSHGAPPATHPALSALKQLAMVGQQPPYRLDEGYSEETRSQSGASDVAFFSSSRADLAGMMEQDAVEHILPEWLMSMSEEQRSEFAYLVLRSLRTSSIAAIVDKLNPLLHIDPVLRLPNEIMFEVLACLDPATLLRVCTLSKTWRSRALESRLWKRLFASEGWNSDIPRVREFEHSERARRVGSKARKIRGRPSDADIERRVSKKRAKAPAQRLFGGDGALDAEQEDSSADWAEQAEPVEADGAEDRMQDVAYQQQRQQQPLLASSSDEQMQLTPPSPSPSGQMQPPLQPLLLSEEFGQEPKINWQYLYKHKRRLEENWNAGRFKNFQLPHPNHPEEAHDECVYTIQYSSSHLVSGSRDKTIRIWDLDTQRLVHVLQGHSQSVLCLQFDERPEHDLIASGGSDTHVLLWRFSTGKLIRRLDKAHTESVLNLRFDERFLITCSKDKTIKVWNRQQLMPGDADYPNRTGSTAKYPSYILNAEQLAAQQGLTGLKPLQQFTLLMTLYGHNAAVNAIQVLDGQIVSASGDRTVKVWEIKSGACLKTITGHLKGIACVQYDGRRIVSGSSDDSVRIFDRVTGAEVACLRGHSNLVRTVQARFGDFPGNEDELEAEARAVDRRYFQARTAGDIPGAAAHATREQRYARNSGSSDPKDIWAWGAKIPPGGGGSRWARIVSGSYDETVIIWRRDAEGRWVAANKLHQWEAVINAGGRPRNPPGIERFQRELQALEAQNAAYLQQAQQAQQQAQQAQQQQPQATGTATATPAAQAVPASAAAPAAPAGQALAHALVNQAQAQIAQATTTIAHAHQAVQQHTNALTPSSTAAQPATTAASSASATATPSASTPVPVAQTASNAAPAAQSSSQQQLPLHTNTTHTTTSGATTVQTAQQQQPALQQAQAQPQPQAQQPAAAPAAAAAAPAAPAGPANAHAHHHHHHHHHPVFGHGHQPGAHAHAGVGAGAAGAGAAGTNSRVFKLQFDSRRIICCSQDPTIVGWDFANGDEDIVAASRFFGEEM